MARSPSAEELKKLIDKMKAIREKIKDNPEEARKVLIAAGILTKSGKLKKIYRV